MTTTVSGQSLLKTAWRVFTTPMLRRSALRCIRLIFKNFFFLQYRAALFPGRIPVTRVDHPLDGKIPFVPGRVAIYLDFVSFWIRAAGFLLDRYNGDAVDAVAEFIDSIGDLYSRAAEVYSANLSTTNRPKYYRRPRFIIIHAFDPHLMCIPSLHVMVVIRAYTAFRAILGHFGDGETCAGQAEEVRRGAVDITEAVLFVKQHSVNCISAAMYAMTRFDGTLFPPAEAEHFAADLFSGCPEIGEEDRNEIRSHITLLYRDFISREKTGEAWTEPLLDFMKNLPQMNFKKS